MGNTDSYEILLVLTAESAKALGRASGARGAGDLATALAAVRPRRGARVLVASDAVFSQIVRIPAAQTAGLSQTELESALFFEVEPFCGIARDDAVIGVEHLANGEWRVAVARRAELASLQTRVHAARCRLVGVAALPREVDAGDPAAVQDALFTGDGPSAAILQPPRGGMSPGTLAAVSAVATLLLALLCACDWLRLSHAERNLRAELAEAEPIAAANARIKREIQADEDHVRAMEAARDRREAALAGLASRRDSWHSLLSTLASDCGDRAVIRVIAADDSQAVDSGAAPRGARVEGLGANPPAAADAMARLSSALLAKGWKVEPGAVTERPGGTASFSFRVSPFGGEGR